MRRLLPHPMEDVDPVEAYAPPGQRPQGRPFVRVNMISSLDGAIAVLGRSSVLGGAADRHLFGVLRFLADVVVVGAGTARTEGYGAARLDEDLRRRREDEGRPAVPPIAVVTRSCHLDWAAPFFTKAEQRPLVVTTADSDPSARRRAAAVADVVVAGEDRVDLDEALRQLQERGYGSALVEGGPRLNAQLVHEGLLDELCLILAPRLVAGDRPRVLAGEELSPPLELETVHLLEEGGFYFYRFAAQPSADDASNAARLRPRPPIGTPPRGSAPSPGGTLLCDSLDDKEDVTCACCRSAQP